MQIIPAIDLMKGQCVRLIQGEYYRQITYEQDPLEQARAFSEEGAEWLHIVDLEGAKIGKPVNTQTVKKIAGLGILKIELGGGIRDQAAIKEMLDAGVERVIIGTKAVSDFKWFCRSTEKFAGKIALALDARGSKVATHGWTQASHKTLLEFAKEAGKLPIAAIIYTDITKDGMMAGPNFERTSQLVDAVDVPVIASGGISDVDSIKSLAVIGVEAAIIGRSLYEGTLKLSEAIQAAG